MRKSLLVFLFFLLSCFDYNPPDTFVDPRWNLTKPFYLHVSPTMPKATMVRESMRDAIGRMGGSISVEPTEQTLYLMDTDGGRCGIQGTQAYVDLPPTNIIFYCHSATVLSSYLYGDFVKISTHELGHELANKKQHIGGDPPPGICTSHTVMSSNSTCRTNLDYSQEDIAYICGGYNTVGGKCDEYRD